MPRPSRPPIMLAHIASLVGRSVMELRSIAEGAATRYETTSRKKRSGGYRRIDKPDSLLMELQRVLLHQLLRRLPGGAQDQTREARSSVANAKSHRRFRNTSVLDIKDAFPSVRRDVVFEALRREGLTRDAAAVVCKLCTRSDSLPQGAPTSGALLGIVLSPLDREVVRRFGRKGVHYTRYADNLTISGASDLSEVERLIERQLRVADLHLNAAKTARKAPGIPVLITGVETSTAARVPVGKMREYVDRLSVAAATDLTEFDNEARGILAWTRHVNIGQAKALWREAVPTESPLRKRLRKKNRRRPE